MAWLDSLDLSVRARRALLNLGVEKRTDLHKVTLQGLVRQKNVGRVTVREIAAMMVENGYSMALPRWITRNR